MEEELPRIKYDFNRIIDNIASDDNFRKVKHKYMIAGNEDPQKIFSIAVAEIRQAVEKQVEAYIDNPQLLYRQQQRKSPKKGKASGEPHGQVEGLDIRTVDG